MPITGETGGCADVLEDGVWPVAPRRNQAGARYLRPMHEMNGNWYPWAEGVNGNVAGDYVNAWRHVRAIFRDTLKNPARRIGGLLRADPRDRGRAVEHQAHGRPSSR